MLVLVTGATLRAIAYVPAENTGCADHENGESVEERGLETRVGFLRGYGWVARFMGSMKGNYGRKMACI